MNLTLILPGGIPALCHAHTSHDEFVNVLQGNPISVTDEGEMQFSLHVCAGFKAGTCNGHQLVNRTTDTFLYLEVGDRSAEDAVIHPHGDFQGIFVEGRWQFIHNDSSHY